jgi:hypothetical protein
VVETLPELGWLERFEEPGVSVEVWLDCLGCWGTCVFEPPRMKGGSWLLGVGAVVVVEERRPAD